ncbi:MAG: hypothetical protein ACI9U2_001090 [Bradymonadia bacterium]|jgi:uncharacterized protein involved in outer membrane biogenesis
MMRRLFKYLGILFLVLIGAIVAVLLIVDFDKVFTEQLQEMRPRISKTLGREVNFGTVKSTLFPLGAEVSDIQIAGRTPEDAPLIVIPKVQARIKLWDAIKSAGSETTLEAFIVQGMRINLVREADGSLSYDDVVKRLSEGPPPEEAPEPLTADQKQFIENLVLERVALEDAEIHLVDKATGGAPATTYIKKLLIEINDVAMVSPFELHVAAAVVAEEPNFDLRIKMGPVPIGKPGAPLPIESIAIKADGIDLARLTPYLGDAAAQIKSATLGLDLMITDPLAAKGRIRLAGTTTIKQLAVGTPPGEAFDLLIAPNVDFNPAAGELDLTGFKVALAEMTLTADGKILDLGAARPRFEGLKIATTAFNFTRLMALLPQIKGALPPGSTVAGPFAISATASGTADAQTIDANLNFDAATIIVPGALSKGKGVPLNAALKADLKPDNLRLERAAIGLGPMALTLSGTVKQFARPIINLKGDTGRFDINGLVRMMPSVAKAVPPDVKIAGQARLNVNIAGTQSALKGTVKLGIFGADLAVPGTTLRGTGEVNVQIAGNPAGTLTLAADTNLTSMGIISGDALNKPAGTPLELHAAVVQSPGATKINNFNLKLGPLLVDGSATFAGPTMDVKASINRFEVAQLATILPALKDNPFAKARLGMRVAAKGNPSVPSSLSATLEDFTFAMGKNALNGKAEVSNLDAPRIRFDFTSPYFDLDSVLPASGDEEAPASDAPPEIPAIVKVIDAAGSLKVRSGIFGGLPFKNFVSTLTMKDGVLRFQALEFDAYDGHFSGAKTQANLGLAQPTFDLKMALKNVNAGQMLADQTTLKREIEGRLSTDIAVSGKGLVWAQMSKSLTGDLGLMLANGRVQSLNLEKAILGPLAQKVPFLSAKKIETGTAFKTLAGTFNIANGKMTLKKPMTLKSPRGDLSVDGAIGLDKSLDLRGTFEVTPALLRTVTGGKINLSKSIPIKLGLGGSITDPKITGLQVEALLTEVAKAAGLSKLMDAKAAVEAEARRRLDAAKAKAMAEVDKAKARAKAEVDKVKAKAKAQIDKAKARAKAEANKAKNKAKDGVKDALKKLF